MAYRGRTEDHLLANCKQRLHNHKSIHKLLGLNKLQKSMTCKLLNCKSFLASLYRNHTDLEPRTFLWHKVESTRALCNRNQPTQFYIRSIDPYFDSSFWSINQNTQCRMSLFQHLRTLPHWKASIFLLCYCKYHFWIHISILQLMTRFIPEHHHNMGETCSRQELIRNQESATQGYYHGQLNKGGPCHKTYQ